MKVFVYYKPTDASDAFEGTRLRKTIKGACEAVNISWVSAPEQGLDVAHFISPSDLLLMREQKEKGVPCVVSAFYAENDPHASYLTDGEKLVLTPRGLTMLNQADLVLVPDERMVAFAKENGVTSHIEVLEPAVRMNRFSKMALESKIFRRYFGVSPSQKIVVATGSYGDKKTVNLVKKVAEACPSLEFYFFGAKRKYDPFNIAKKITRLKRTANMHFKDIVQDDVYRSALMNSLAYISNDSVRPDPITSIEAFASQTQVVAFDSARPNPLLKENETCYFFTSPEEMAKYLTSLNLGSAESTIDSAYAIAKAHNLISYGKALQKHYESLTTGEKR